MKVANNQSNRIDAAQDQWEAQHAKYVARYGEAVVYDRDYQKVRMDVLGQIYKQYKNDTKLTREEKMDLRMLKGQFEQLNRSLYSAPMRLLRGVGSIIGSILKAAILLPARIMSMLVLNRPIQNNNALTQARRPVIAASPGLQTGKVVNGINRVKIIPKANTEKAQNQQNNIATPPAKVVQRNFKHKPPRVVALDKGKSPQM